MSELSYTVGGLSCEHCRTAITEEVERVSGVTGVEIDLDAKLVVVRGENVSDVHVRAAIEEAGYEAA
jgi:copper chaperone CopZ